MSGRRAAPVVAVVLAFALGYWVRGCGEESAAPPVTERPHAPESVASHEPSSRAPPRRARAEDLRAPASRDVATDLAPAAAPADAASEDDDVREIPLDGAPTGWTEVTVQIVDSDGRPVKGSRVRTSPSSERTGDYDYDTCRDDGPWADVDATGRCRLRLSAPARFDLRAHRSLWSLWRTDVLTPQTTDVRLTDSPLDDLEITTAEPLAAGERMQLRLCAVSGTVGASGDGTLVAPTGNADWFELTLEQPARRWRLPTALRWRVEGRETTFVEPVFTRPGTVVRLRRAPGVLTIQARAGGDGWGRLGRSSVPLDVVTTAGPSATVRVGTLLADGDPAGTASLRVDTPAGIVRWSGADVEPGEASYDVAASPILKIAVHARRTARGPDARVLLEVAPGRENSEPVLDGEVGASSDVRCGWSVAFAVGAETPVPQGDGEWAVVLPNPQRDPPDCWVAGPVRLRAGTCRTMTYAPGGFVVTAPSGRLPAGAGDVTVSRADGAPLVADESSADRVVIEPGTVLGPFPPGTVVLDIAVGGVLWARREVRVRSEESTVLPIGPFGRR